MHHHDYMRVYEDLYSTLVREQKLRGERRDPVDGTNESEWVVKERQVMLDRTRAWLMYMDGILVSMEDIERVEERAAGHIDYTKKFAIGCADLVAQYSQIRT